MHHEYILVLDVPHHIPRIASLNFKLHGLGTILSKSYGFKMKKNLKKIIIFLI